MSGYTMPNPSNIRTWNDDQRRRHRYRRALHELMAGPSYHLRVEEGRILVGPKELVTPEAREFIRQHRDDLLVHLQWLGEVE